MITRNGVLIPLKQVLARDSGLEWDLGTPRSASRNATGFEAIEKPRSAWMVSWSRSMFCSAMVCVGE